MFQLLVSAANQQQIFSLRLNGQLAQALAGQHISLRRSYQTARARCAREAKRDQEQAFEIPRLRLQETGGNRTTVADG
jgi:hypothetical protein